MFGERRSDRRRSYSFKQHFHRALATKGLRRVITPIVATAVIAGVSFANCSSDGITGPDGGSARGPGPSGPISANTSGGDGGGTGGGSGTIATPFPVTEEEIPTTIAEVEVPTGMQATTCNQDVVNWEEARTRGSGVSYLNPKTGAMRVKIKFTQHAKGTGTVFPKRYYVGYEVYEKEVFMALGTSSTEEEFDLHIIAEGENKVRMFNDDYMLRLKVRITINNGQMSMESRTMEKCF